MVEDRLISLKKKEKNCHIYTIGKTGHINEPNSISPNCSGDSTHFRLFLINAIKSPEIMGNWKFKHKLKWKKLFFFENRK